MGLSFDLAKHAAFARVHANLRVSLIKSVPATPLGSGIIATASTSLPLSPNTSSVARS